MVGTLRNPETKGPFTDHLDLVSLAQALAPETAFELIDDRFIDEVEKWTWRKDPVRSIPESAIAISVAFYGEHLDSAKAIHQKAIHIAQQGISPAEISHMTPVPDKTASTGFPTLYQVTPGLSSEQYRLTQQVVAKDLISSALSELSLSPSDVHLVIVTSSIPISEDFDLDAMKAACIPLDRPSVRVCMACNSSGWAIAQVAEGRFNDEIAAIYPEFSQGQPANILLFALDDANRLSDKGNDRLAPQFFSTGAAAMVWQHSLTHEHSTFKPLSHESRSVEEGTKYLKIAKNSGEWKSLPHRPLFTAQYLKSPSNPNFPDAPVEMQERVGLIFYRFTASLVEDLLSKFETEHQGHVSDIKRVIIHHPSKAVFTLLGAKLAELGFTSEQVQWVIDEGNVPVATIPIALSRQLNDLEPGDTIAIISYGAGGEYTGMIAQLGNVATDE